MAEDYINLENERLDWSSVKGTAWDGRSGGTAEMLEAVANDQWDRVIVTVAFKDGTARTFSGPDAKTIHERVGAGITVSIGEPKIVPMPPANGHKHNGKRRP